MNRLKELREKKEWTIYRLQEESGVNRSLIKRLETGERDFEKIALKTAYKLAQALGATIEELFYN